MIFEIADFKFFMNQPGRNFLNYYNSISFIKVDRNQTEKDAEPKRQECQNFSDIGIRNHALIFVNEERFSAQ